MEKICSNFKYAQKELNTIVAEKLHAMINLIENSETLNDINAMQIYRLHPLHGNKEGQFALDLGRKLGYRLIFLPLDDKGECCKEKDMNVMCKKHKYY